MPRALRLLASLVVPALLAACSSGGSTSATTTGTSSTTGGGGAAGEDPYEFATAPASCAYDCSDDHCPERQGQSYVCPSLGAWSKIPHADTCPSWDGSFPTPHQGQCSATAPKGEALKYAGKDPDDPQTLVMPGGRRLTPAGSTYVFPDPRSMTTSVIAVPGTRFVLTVDTGYGDHLVRVIDADKIGDPSAVLSQLNFPVPESLNQGIAFSAPDRVYVATAQGKVQALSLDLATGQLTRDDAHSLPLPPGVGPKGSTELYLSGIGVSADGKRLFATTVDDKKLFVLDIEPGSPSYGTLLGQVGLGDVESYAVYTDPHDPSTRFVYVTMWSGSTVKEVDLLDPTNPKLTRTFAVGKDPQGLAFLDGRWMVVGNDLGDTLSLIDRVSGTVTVVPIESDKALKALEPSSLSYDETAKRLYATLAGLNAVSAFDVDLAKDPPQIVPAGRLATHWWPSGSVVRPDGSLVVISMLGKGVGPRLPEEEYELLHGSIQHIPAPSAAALSQGEAIVAANDQVLKRAGYPTIDCPTSVNDFPIPPTNTSGPSNAIEHVILVVRENKTYDGLFGDLPGGKGDPTMTMIPKEEMDGTWTNIRKLARSFSLSDNFYTSAFISTQGHLWTTHGRTDDFNEREWPVTGYGRGLRSDADSGGVIEVGRPEEGSIFDWLGNNDVPYDLLGEIVGLPRSPKEGTNPIDSQYPGGPVQSIGYPDVEKACYVAGRIRVVCDLRKVVYMTLPNDHTQGLSPTSPTPQTMFAANDEATGILVEAISHSPIWKNSLVIITEDDPAQGGESVDYHRTVLVMASPWVKRGYVSHTNVDVSAIHKIIAHVLAIPYPNQLVADAAIPFDMFTSTPDYSPYDHAARSFPAVCGNMATSAERRITDSWDFEDLDRQPGLGAQIDRQLHGRQLTTLPPALEAEVVAREIQKARQQAAGRDDD